MMNCKIAIVSDCGGQAMGRMMLRTLSLFPDAQVVPFECDSLAAASGNIVDAVDAGANIVLCNSAPRKDARKENGDAIVLSQYAGCQIVSTIGALNLLLRFAPRLDVSKVDIEAFMVGRNSRRRFNFRGLEVIPLIAKARWDGEDLSSFLLPCYGLHSPVLDHIWLVDEIEGRPANLKLSVLRSDLPEFAAGRDAEVKFYGRGQDCRVGCYERLTDIPPGTLGLYEGSSGLGDERFLEIALMGGSAAELLEVQRGGTPLTIEIL